MILPEAVPQFFSNPLLYGSVSLIHIWGISWERISDEKAGTEMENSELRNSVEKRIRQLIAQRRGIPLQEVMQLLLQADSNSHIAVDEEMEKLFKKYADQEVKSSK